MRSETVLMLTLDEILQALCRLTPKEQARVRAELDALERAEESGREAVASGDRKAVMKDWLAMAGIGHSDFTDVSTDKYKHLGDVYADKR